MKKMRAVCMGSQALFRCLQMADRGFLMSPHSSSQLYITSAWPYLSLPLHTQSCTPTSLALGPQCQQGTDLFWVEMGLHFSQSQLFMTSSHAYSQPPPAPLPHTHPHPKLHTHQSRSRSSMSARIARIWTLNSSKRVMSSFSASAADTCVVSHFLTLVSLCHLTAAEFEHDRQCYVCTAGFRACCCKHQQALSE